MMSDGYQKADITQIWPKKNILTLVGGRVMQRTLARCGKK
jgi:hypothetical protein